MTSTGHISGARGVYASAAQLDAWPVLADARQRFDDELWSLLDGRH